MNIYSPYEIDVEQLSADPKSWEVFAHKFMTSSGAVKDILLLNAAPFLETLSYEHGLSEEQAMELSRIVRDVLFADIFINDMTTIIGQRLSLAAQASQQIRDKIINELFAPAAEDIKKIQRDKFPDRIGQGSAPIQQPRPAQSMPVLPPPPQTPAGAPPVNENNIINLRDRI